MCRQSSRRPTRTSWFPLLSRILWLLPSRSLLRERAVVGEMVDPTDRSVLECLEPGNVTLFGKRAFSDVLKLWVLRGDPSRLPRLALNPLTSILIKDPTEHTLGRKPDGKTEADISAVRPQAKEASNQQKLEEAKNRFSPKASRRSTALHYLDFRPLASRE